MAEQSKAEKLARTLEYLVKQGLVPGLLPEKVSAAADLLRSQEAELASLRTAMATKKHAVEVAVKRENYHSIITGTYIITDPIIYYSEMTVDNHELRDPHYFAGHVARSLTRRAINDWSRDLEQQGYVRLIEALERMKP